MSNEKDAFGKISSELNGYNIAISQFKWERKGKNVFDFFVGQVMKATRGQANPSMTAKIIKEEIEKR